MALMSSVFNDHGYSERKRYQVNGAALAIYYTYIMLGQLIRIKNIRINNFSKETLYETWKGS